VEHPPRSGAGSPPHHAARPPAVDDRYRLLVEGIQDYAILMLDPDGWVTTWNSGAERMKGYAPEEIIGRHFSLFYPAEDLAAEKPGLELRSAVLAGRFEDEGWRVRKDGSRFWANVVITPLRRADGELMGFAKATRDLTARRQVEDALRRSEARLSGIIESAMDAILTVNEEQRVVAFNGAAEAMFRCPAHDAIGKSLERLIPERFRRAHSSHIAAFAHTGVTSRSMWTPGTLVGLRADGEEFPIEATISQIITGGQRFFTVILRDATERTRVEAQLREALESAQGANRAKGEFLAMMSHELRTPLNAIGGYVQLLEMELRGPVTVEQRADLARIRRSGQHLLSVINDILNFAQVEAGQLGYALTEVALDDLVLELEELIAPQMRAKEIRYEPGAGAWPRGEGPIRVQADADKVRQILLNLLTNAVKFTEPGGRVTVDGTVEPDRVLVRVSDTGCGIPADKLDAVFEPFVQLHRSLTRPVDGTGLGLAISRHLARQMGGELTAASALGQGSTFTLVLPRARGGGRGDARPGEAAPRVDLRLVRGAS
jgi:PAS domain S-box-containing protein